MKILGKEFGKKQPIVTAKKVEGAVELTIKQEGKPTRVVTDYEDHEAASDRIWENLRHGHQRTEDIQ